MIDKLKYEDIIAIAAELKKQAEIVEKLAQNRNIQDLVDFAATVEGYSKFLENTVEMNKDADIALNDLIIAQKNFH
ncbi:MAG: hypothetical protein IJI22_05395 [Bacilli bacterium]|nr:hypothetical protein [Bacilli bacterium]